MRVCRSLSCLIRSCSALLRNGVNGDDDGVVSVVVVVAGDVDDDVVVVVDVVNCTGDDEDRAEPSAESGDLRALMSVLRVFL